MSMMKFWQITLAITVCGCRQRCGNADLSGCVRTDHGNRHDQRQPRHLPGCAGTHDRDLDHHRQHHNFPGCPRAGDRNADRQDARLSKALDKINAKYGRGTIFHLSEGIAKPWQMRRDMLTPNYTTSWSQDAKSIS